MGKLLSGLITATLLAFAPQPASARAVNDSPRNTIPATFSTAGWWDKPAANQTRWAHPTFPIACTDGAKAFRILWVHPTGRTTTLNRAEVRKAAGAAASIFAASAKRTIANRADLEHSLAPRYAANANCQPTVTNVTAPRAVINADIDSPDGLWAWLRGRGYDSPRVKYLSILQVAPNPLQWGGVADVDVTPGDPGPSNAANAGSHLTILGSDDWRLMVWAIAHEMTHSLGAVSGEAPNFNPNHPGHPTDCGDILCNGDPGRDNWRLDVNRDDYFAPGADWTTQRWAVSNSSFLWGNP